MRCPCPDMEDVLQADDSNTNPISWPGRETQFADIVLTPITSSTEKDTVSEELKVSHYDEDGAFALSDFYSDAFDKELDESDLNENGDSVLLHFYNDAVDKEFLEFGCEGDAETSLPEFSDAGDEDLRESDCDKNGDITLILTPVVENDAADEQQEEFSCDEDGDLILPDFYYDADDSTSTDDRQVEVQEAVPVKKCGFCHKIPTDAEREEQRKKMKSWLEYVSQGRKGGLSKREKAVTLPTQLNVKVSQYLEQRKTICHCCRFPLPPSPLSFSASPLPSPTAVTITACQPRGKVAKSLRHYVLHKSVQRIRHQQEQEKNGRLQTVLAKIFLANQSSPNAGTDSDNPEQGSARNPCPDSEVQPNAEAAKPKKKLRKIYNKITCSTDEPLPDTETLSRSCTDPEEPLNTKSSSARQRFLELFSFCRSCIHTED